MPTLLTAPLLSLLLAPPQAAPPDSATAIAARVEIVRTEYGVPHILAEDLKAMGFGLGWVQSEDYGDRVAVGLVQNRGEYALHVGYDSIDGDFGAREAYAIAIETHHRLDPETREVYEGFAQGVNHYVRLHPERFPEWMTPTFTAYDVHAGDVLTWSRGDGRSFVRWLERRTDSLRAAERIATGSEEERLDAEAFHLDGSNAWAFHGSRTESGNTILLRNPHLSWDAGYYEAHVRVPGLIDFYGDFRIGGAFGIVGGFNAELGFATTNNYPTYSQVYALEVDAQRPGHVLLDGAPVPLAERSVTVPYRTADGVVASETRTTWWTPFGPVVHRAEDRVYILKDPRAGEWRRGDQFLRMMRADSLEEWLDAMSMRAHPSSNLTYADRAGNIVHFYNARLPLLPHEPTGDSAAVARSWTDMWSELVPVEDLPLWMNPPGGYVQQANDSPDYTNLNVVLDRDTVPANLEERRLRLRSQLSLSLAHAEAAGDGDDGTRGERLSLEDVMRLKHSPRMLLAERVLDELIAAVEDGGGTELAGALEVLRRWDRTAAADSRGGTLFERWVDEYQVRTDTLTFYRERWDPERPMETPVGIGAPDSAVVALRAAVAEMREDSLALDVEWGEVHRVVRGDVDEPVSGCDGTLGCFRTLSFEETEDGRLAANRGDGWVLLVEFGEVPRAYSVLASGQSADESSPHYDDQAALFARGEMKRVAWTAEDIERRAIARYSPGEPARDR